MKNQVLVTSCTSFYPSGIFGGNETYRTAEKNSQAGVDGVSEECWLRCVTLCPYWQLAEPARGDTNLQAVQDNPAVSETSEERQ